MLETKPIEQIVESDLTELINQGVSEGKAYEFKQQLWRIDANDPKEQRSQRLEFLRDVSSFANTAGGHIFVGFEEKDGKAHALVGLDVAGNEDKTLRLLDDLMQRWIKPRILVGARFVPIASGKPILVIRVMPSAIAPHRVCISENGTFHARNSQGKYEMDVDDLRTAFNANASIARRIRDFHAERLRLVSSADSPIPLKVGPQLVVHLIPQECFASTISFKIPELREATANAFPISGNQSVSRDKINLDGPLKTVGDPARAYLQVFRSGVLEAIYADVVTGAVNEPLLYNFLNEKCLLDSLPTYFEVFKKLDLRPPVALFLTLTGMRNVAIPQDLSRPTFDRDVISVPEMLVEDMPSDVSSIVQEIGGVIWNAAGLPRCDAFDQNGKWRLLQRLA